MTLELSGHRHLRLGLVFVCPEDEAIRISGGDAKIQLAEKLGTRDIDDGLVDEHMGLKVMPVAQLTITTGDGAAESAVFMTKDDLRRHVFEARALLQIMDGAAALADAQWAPYRAEVRRRAND